MLTYLTEWYEMLVMVVRGRDTVFRAHVTKMSTIKIGFRCNYQLNKD